jgi:hypothetical protein
LLDNSIADARRIFAPSDQLGAAERRVSTPGAFSRGADAAISECAERGVARLALVGEIAREIPPPAGSTGEVR